MTAAVQTRPPTIQTAPREIVCRDDACGLNGVIVIDDTTLGPGLGGVRYLPYADFDHARRECRRLAATMTRKNAVADLPFGGAKAVLVAGPGQEDRAATMRRFGDFVASAGGDYLPGVDMGTGVHDLAVMAEAGCVVSCSTEDPSRWTALGVEAAIRAAVAHSGLPGLTGLRVLVQGAGHVGAGLAASLACDGAQVLVADVDRDRAAGLAARIGGAVVDPGEVIDAECDVFAPCAVAGVLNPASIARLRCRIVAGAANDVLSAPEDADLLAARGITYVPDYVSNAGGVIDIQALRAGWDERRLRREVLRIGERTAHLLSEADATARTPLAVAEGIAAARLAAAAEAA